MTLLTALRTDKERARGNIYFQALLESLLQSGAAVLFNKELREINSLGFVSS
jgi:hypothetical protein